MGRFAGQPWGFSSLTQAASHPSDAPGHLSDREQKRLAFDLLYGAWCDAQMEGVDGDCLAQACLFTALAELVSTYGEEAAADFAARLPERIRAGEFTLVRHPQ